MPEACAAASDKPMRPRGRDVSPGQRLTTGSTPTKPQSGHHRIQGSRLALLQSAVVVLVTAIYCSALKASPELLPGPVPLFFIVIALSAGSFLLISVKVAWVFDPTHHRRHFTMMALSLPLHYFFFSGILDAYLNDFLPVPAFIAFLGVAFLTAYASASAAALAVIFRHRLGFRKAPSQLD